jgi:uncharacterized membrane protein
MRSKITWVDGVALIVCLLPITYLLYIYPQLPNTVALHFDAKGDPNGWGPKSEVWLVVLLLAGLSLGISVLLRFLPKIDPKKKVRYSEGALARIGYAITFFMAALNVMIVYASLHGHFAMKESLFFPLIGLFYAYLGNLFNNLKPNYFVGIRTPWTLENEAVWRKTHQWGGRVWVIGGLALAVATFVLPSGPTFIVFISGTLCLALAPVIYSYWYYQQLQKSK